MKRAIVVTTQHRGVFFGYSECSLLDENIILEGMRNCLKWSKTIGGVFGLAEVGPNNECNVGMMVTGKTGLKNITAILECTEQAEKAWLKAPTVGQ